jgi:hypothetical protein
MLEQGIDVPDIVMKLRLELAIVKHLHDEYVEETGGLLVPGEVRRIARKAGYEVGPDNFVDLLIHLLEAGRSRAASSTDRLSRLIVVPDE